MSKYTSALPVELESRYSRNGVAGTPLDAPKRQRARYVDLALDRLDIVARPGEEVAADVGQKYGEDYRRAQAGLIEVGNGDVGRGGVGDAAAGTAKATATGSASTA